MEDRLRAWIEAEDQRNPYTDQSLAQKLSISRSEVTLLRLKLGIPDSRERRKPALLKTIQRIVASDPRASERVVTQRLKQSGYSVSRFTVAQLLKEARTVPANGAGLPAPAKMAPAFRGKAIAGSAFGNMIGKDGSLFPIIEQAKAAILYPPRGLHTLLLGATGVGKSDLAEAMYRFAVETGNLKADAPFVVFNCADYADNPQLLLSQLFGYAKGAFTGAEHPKEGLIEKADRGILFLDEVHRLPPEGQEILFYLIDKGKFRRLGETESLRKVSVMLIAATTEDPSAALLATFRRRVPMVIELPSLQERPLKERLALIQYFLKREAQRTGSSLTVDGDALKSLLLYDCPGNIGQLSSDIQVVCARGFLNRMTSGDQTIHITLANLLGHARRGLLKLQNQRAKIEKLRITNSMVVPGEGDVFYTDDLYSLPREVYSYIEEQYWKLSTQGVSQEEINRLIGLELEAKFLKWFKRVDESAERLVKSDLYKLVGKSIVDTVEKMVQKASLLLNRLDERIVAGLAIHLAETLERIKQNKPIINPHLAKTKQEYAREFAIAKEMADCFKESAGIELPEEEIGFITLYLTMQCRQEVYGRVGVLVLSHGHVAAGMAEVANRLLGVNHAKAVEMSLDENAQSALQRAVEMVIQIDEGKGVLVLADMGSLTGFGCQIAALTGIPVRSVAPVYTMMVIEAVRRALLPDSTLDDLAGTLGQQLIYTDSLSANWPERDSSRLRRSVVLAICITGQGAAVQLQKSLERMLQTSSNEVEVICLGLADRQKFNAQVSEITLAKSVKAVVGTLDPCLPGIPFITAEQILRGNMPTVLQDVLKQAATLEDVLLDDLIFFPNPELTKPQIIDLLAENLLAKSFVEPGFAADVIKRELIGVPIMNPRVAVPHSDPRYVKKTSVALAVFPEPVPWGGGYRVNIVCLLALTTDGKDILQELDTRLGSNEILESLLREKTPAEVKRVLLGASQH